MLMNSTYLTYMVISSIPQEASQGVLSFNIEPKDKVIESDS